MTLFVDQNERAGMDALIQHHGVGTERLLLNRPAPNPRPDYGFYTFDGSWLGASLKQAGEYIGAMDACQSQLMEEMQACDYMALLIEGVFTSSPNGGCYTWDWDRKAFMGSTRQGMNYGNVRMVRREYAQSYKGVMMQLARYWDLGIHVIFTHDMEDTALSLVALHNELTKDTATLTTFKRLIPQRYVLSEEDLAKRTLALQLMGAVPGVGEEVALAIADASWVSSLARLCYLLENAPEGWDDLAKLPLRSGKRKVGLAAVKRIREALGV